MTLNTNTSTFAGKNSINLNISQHRSRDVTVYNYSPFINDTKEFAQSTNQSSTLLPLKSMTKGLSSLDKEKLLTYPLEIALRNQNLYIFLKVWSKFHYQFSYSNFKKLLSEITLTMKSLDWYRAFLDNTATREFY